MFESAHASTGLSVNYNNEENRDILINCSPSVYVAFDLNEKRHWLYQQCASHIEEAKKRSTELQVKIIAKIWLQVCLDDYKKTVI